MTPAPEAPPAPARPPRAGDRPMTRRGCVLGVAAWLVVMSLPLCALLLAVRGELAWRRGDFAEDRVWVVRQAGGAGPDSAAGLAYSRTRVAGRPSPGGDLCTRTQVYFLLWRGQSETVAYCECYQALEGGGYAPTGACP